MQYEIQLLQSPSYCVGIIRTVSLQVKRKARLRDFSLNIHNYIATIELFLHYAILFCTWNSFKRCNLRCHTYRFSSPFYLLRQFFFSNVVLVWEVLLVETTSAQPFTKDVGQNYSYLNFRLVLLPCLFCLFL